LDLEDEFTEVEECQHVLEDHDGGAKEKNELKDIVEHVAGVPLSLLRPERGEWLARKAAGQNVFPNHLVEEWSGGDVCLDYDCVMSGCKVGCILLNGNGTGVKGNGNFDSQAMQCIGEATDAAKSVDSEWRGAQWWAAGAGSCPSSVGTDMEKGSSGG